VKIRYQHPAKLESVFLDANIIVILISLTLFLAYIGGILYSKTHIPDIF